MSAVEEVSVGKSEEAINLAQPGSHQDVSVPIEPSEEMQELLEHHKQIKTWMKDVEERISKLETSYLEDTPMGNIVRGWEQSKVFSSRSRRVTDKERLFSHSSYAIWLESKNRPPEESKEERESLGFVKNKRMRRGVHKKESIAATSAASLPDDSGRTFGKAPFGSTVASPAVGPTVS